MRMLHRVVERDVLSEHQTQGNDIKEEESAASILSHSDLASIPQHGEKRRILLQ